jgi:two-component system, NarL family, sensor kinase
MPASRSALAPHRDMTLPPRPSNDATVGIPGAAPGTGQRLAAWARVAVTVAVLNTIAVAAAVVIAAETSIYLPIVETGTWINLVAAPAFPLLAAFMLRNRGRDPDRPPDQDRLAWLFLGFGALCAATIVLHVFVMYGLRHHGPVILPVAWVYTWLWIGVPTGLLLALLWFPTGDVPGPRWRWAVGGVAVSLAAIWLAIAFSPGPMPAFSGHIANPVGWTGAGPALRVIGFAGFLTLAVTAVATLASVAWRFYRGDAAVRAQLRWLLGVVAVIAITIAVPGPKALAIVIVALNVIATFLLPVTLAVTLVRRDGLVLPRLLVYGSLSALLLAAYIAVVGLALAVLGSRADRAAIFVAAGLIAVLAAPLRARLQRSVDRLIYGARGDPYAALADLGRRITGSPGDLLHQVVRAVADALRAPYAAVVLTGEQAPAASAGRRAGPEIVVPLTLRGRQAGSLIVAQRTPNEHYSQRDLTLLRDLAQHIAVAAHAATLTSDLQRSRESLVAAREEERRRIRRDLHDGLGPALAGIMFGLDAARNTLATDPQATAVTLAELKSEVQASITGVRRLVYDLRPPDLDQLGLVPAVQAYAARLGERGALDICVSAPALPPLPAAVEVAAYRIAAEALTNAARHSRARHTMVAFTIENAQLRLEVTDDGVGIATRRDDRCTGVGLAAMAERAAELGGACSVGSRDGGTAVVAVLPLRVTS